MLRQAGLQALWTASTAALLLAGTVAGCKNGADKAPAAPTDSSTATKAATPTAVPADASTAAPAAAAFELRGVGFATPESVLHDPEADVYLVTNINGSPLAADDNGFISQVGPDGQLRALRWIDGASAEVELDAPKGMALAGDTLYVADITRVRRFDRRSGKQLGSVELPGSSFVNDLVADAAGVVYASDSGLRAGGQGLAPSGSDAVWKIEGDRASPLVKEPALGRPNGLARDGDQLVVVTFGSGELYRIDPAGQRGPASKAPKGALDGVVRLDSGALLVSSWEAQAVYQLDAQGSWSLLLSGLPAPADIGLDRRRGRLLIPLFNDDALLVRPL